MAAAPARSSLFAPTEAVGRYEVGELIAAGGMGAVYRGFDKLAKRELAYKRIRVLDESTRPRLAALFQREYDTLRRLTHPNIVEAYDFGFDVQGPFYTMELLPGEDLAKLGRCRFMRPVASCATARSRFPHYRSARRLARAGDRTLAARGEPAEDGRRSGALPLAAAAARATRQRCARDRSIDLDRGAFRRSTRPSAWPTAICSVHPWWIASKQWAVWCARSSKRSRAREESFFSRLRKGSAEARYSTILLVLSAHAGKAAQDPQVLGKLESSAQRIGLAPLNERALAELVGTTFGGVPNCQSLARWLFAQAGGNPAHTMDLARLLLAQGAVRYTGGTFILPHEFTAGLAGNSHAEARLASLSSVSAGARGVVELLALHSGPLSVAELARAHGCGAGEVVTFLDELVQRGAVVARGESFGCASEVLRSALARAMTQEQACSAHVALARAIAKRTAASSLDDPLATAEHLLQADDVEQLEGALLLARAAERHKFEIGMRPTAHPALEAALKILERHGLSDEDLIGLLVPLCMAGFYGDITMQRRYLDRALGALSSICGLKLARRLARFIGPKAALALGLLSAFVAHLFRRHALARRSFIEHLESLTGVTGPATAAAACTFDLREAWRVVAWLEPLAAAPQRSPLFFMREFCVATAELVSAKFTKAARRYAQLVSVYERPVFGIDAKHAIQIRSGCLNGWAQALVTDTGPEALAVAERLDRAGGGAFFAPHAEAIRATYHAYRGEALRAAGHRERAEVLSLQAGTCWSAMSVLTVRSVLVFVLSNDVIGLVRTIAELERLSKRAESLALLHELALAHLDLLRGHPELAIARYERLFANEVVRNLPTYPVERALHAQALSVTGDHAGARALCLALLEEVAARDDGERVADLLYCLPRMQLALAEAGLGELADAAKRLDACLARGGGHENPMLLGALQRDRAYVAALAGDAKGFERHFAQMKEHFYATENPSLIQQCEALRARTQMQGSDVASPAPTKDAPATLDTETAFERPGRQPTSQAAGRDLKDAG